MEIDAIRRVHRLILFLFRSEGNADSNRIGSEDAAEGDKRDDHVRAAHNEERDEGDDHGDRCEDCECNNICTGGIAMEYHMLVAALLP